MSLTLAMMLMAVMRLMSPTPTIPAYLVDENADYLLDELGNRLVDV